MEFGILRPLLSCWEIWSCLGEMGYLIVGLRRLAGWVCNSNREIWKRGLELGGLAWVYETDGSSISGTRAGS
jgi:hypothetical protein